MAAAGKTKKLIISANYGQKDGNFNRLPPRLHNQQRELSPLKDKPFEIIHMLSEQYPFTEIILKIYKYTIYIIIHGEQIAHLSFAANRHLLAIDRIRSILPNCIIRKEVETNSQICRELKEYLTGHRRDFNLTVSPFFLKRATPLRQRIWQRISSIPYGKTTTYGNIGRELGNPALARAIGQAANANPVGLIIPCHRVTGQHNMGGYAGGPMLKKYLLQMERDSRREIIATIGTTL